MNRQDTVSRIPRDTAMQLCAEIRKQYDGKWWTLAGMQCWGCSTFSQNEAHRCVASRPDYRGCNLVNTRYDQSKSM